MNQLKRLLKNFESLSIPGFSDTHTPTKKSATRKYAAYATKKNGVILAACLVLAAAIGAYSLIQPNQKVNDLYPGVSPSPTTKPSGSPELVGGEPSPSAIASAKPKPKVSPTPSPVASPTAAPTPSPTTPSPTPTVPPSPSPSPQPPVMKITFPAEGQSVVFTNPEQTLCVVDVPVANTYGSIQRKTSLNGGAWTGYVDHFTYCYEPKEGANSFQAQYKNVYGLESVVYSVNFTFHRSSVD